MIPQKEGDALCHRSQTFGSGRSLPAYDDAPGISTRGERRVRMKRAIDWLYIYGLASWLLLAGVAGWISHILFRGPCPP